LCSFLVNPDAEFMVNRFTEHLYWNAEVDLRGFVVFAHLGRHVFVLVGFEEDVPDWARSDLHVDLLTLFA